jgi:phosphohistidine phosphatase
MKRQILLLRHAKSAWDDPALADIDRPLSPRGRKAAKRMGRHLAERGLAPERVICSSARRTRETLALVEEGLGRRLETGYEPRVYLGEPRALLALLRAVHEGVASVMLIGHDPGLPGLALSLTRGATGPLVERVQAKFPTGALALLSADTRSWKGLKSGSCRLDAFIVPREL